MATYCMGPLVSCNLDCLCAQSLNGLYQCVASGGSTLGCGAMFMSATPAAQSLAQCTAGNCQMPCGL
jgi:hypothetical protein